MSVRLRQALRDAVCFVQQVVRQLGSVPVALALARVLAPCCASFLVVSLAVAQNVMVYEDQIPVAQDVADILSRGAAERPRQRAGLGDGLGAPLAPLAQKPVSDVGQANALSVPLQFTFDASSLTEQSRAQLSAIAEGIRRIDATLLVVIEGHTDAGGRASYNKRLSLRRALAVRDFLVSEGKVAAKVLTVEGKGSQQLLDTADPYNLRNRRIQFSAR